MKDTSEYGVEIGEIGSSASVLQQELLDGVIEKRFQKFEVILRPGFTNRSLHFRIFPVTEKGF